jgi:hypothetical protein
MCDEGRWHEQRVRQYHLGAIDDRLLRRWLGSIDHQQRSPDVVRRGRRGSLLEGRNASSPEDG